MESDQDKNWKQLKKILEEGKENPASGSILWVGAGVSTVAGYPDTRELVTRLDKKTQYQLPAYQPFGSFEDSDSPAFSFNEWVNYFLEENGEEIFRFALKQAVSQKKSALLTFHENLVSLPWRYIFTTNYDELLEKALQKIERDFVRFSLGKPDKEDWKESSSLELHKIWGTASNFEEIVQSIFSEIPYPFQNPDLAKIFFERSTLYIGCSFTDPAFFRWLEDCYRQAKLHQLKESWIIIRKSDWEQIQKDKKSLLTEGNINPIFVEQYEDLEEELRQFRNDFGVFNLKKPLEEKTFKNGKSIKEDKNGEISKGEEKQEERPLESITKDASPILQEPNSKEIRWRKNFPLILIIGFFLIFFGLFFLSKMFSSS